jgi:formylmethanofuran dehydrogenase subunit C
MITLTPKGQSRIPVNGKCISTDVFAAHSLSEIASLAVWEGNRERLLSDLFAIEGETDDKTPNMRIRIAGDAGRVRRIGTCMTKGEIIVDGNAGMHLGEEMVGGKITVLGNADSWTGSMMKGGIITVAGNVNDYLGAAYRGLTTGMQGGTITVEGDAGNEAGCFMTGGVIRIRKNAGIFAGIHMKGGTLMVDGDAAERAGAMMTGGRVVVSGKIPSILPSFIVDEIRSSVRVGEERVSGPFYVFKGDVTESWNGSLYISVKNNPHLKGYETKIV